MGRTARCKLGAGSLYAAGVPRRPASVPTGYTDRLDPARAGRGWGCLMCAVAEESVARPFSCAH